MSFEKRARADAEAISRHESAVKLMLREPKRMIDPLMELLNEPEAQLELARIAVAAQLDEAEAGRQFKAFAERAAHELARYQLGDDAEVIEPRSALPMVAEIFADFRSGKAFGMSLPERNPVVDAARGVKPGAGK